ncbi:T9SS type A sorting domain-containing protein [Crocinitomix catalasitica]|uniref:T9SS type A sorting domain-containing protein n=1 Tax=Crocinitomix catalasitica TaxID=184607 RepID=UPI0004817826|nr:T9SS type A sorting domain-containing protein [Crocinitomix catalasitica]
MNKIILLLISFIFPLAVLAQWEEKAESVTTSFLAVDIHESGVCYAVGYPFMKSEDDGETWAEVEFPGADSIYFKLVVLFDVKILSETTIVAVGRSALNDNNVIIRSSDSGESWSVVYAGATGNRLEFRSVAFYDELSGIAVGENGIVVETTDGGETWVSRYSGTENLLTAVEYMSESRAIAVGYETIIRSTDGGGTWSVDTYSDKSFKSVSYYLADNELTATYITAPYKDMIFKSSDYGFTWTTQDISFERISCHKVLPGDSIYLGYEYGMLLGLTEDIHLYEFIDYDFEGISDIEFKNGYGLAVTEQVDESKIYKFYYDEPWNLSQMVDFSYPDTICAGETTMYTCSNPTLDSYEWLIDEVSISELRDFEYTHEDAGEFNIMLVTEFEGNSDTIEHSITVISTPEINPIEIVADSAICQGSDYRFNLIDIADGTGYRVMIEGVEIEYARATGDDRLYYFDEVDANLTFNIDKWIVNECDSVSVSEEFALVVDTYPDSSTVFYTSDSLVCFGDSTAIVLPIPEIGVEYTIYQDGDSIAAGLSIDGTMMSFHSLPITSNHGFTIEANSENGCHSVFDMIDSTHVEVADATFSAGLGYFFQNELIEIETDDIVGYTYEWSSDGSPDIYTDLDLLHPSIAYDEIGVYELNLSVESEHIGCRDSLTKIIQVFNDLIPDSLYEEICHVIDNNRITVLDQTVDPYGNLIVVGYKEDEIQGHWGTILDGVLQKFNSEGELVWEFVLERDIPSYDDHKSSIFNSVDTDQFGNIFFTGTFDIVVFDFFDEPIWAGPRGGGGPEAKQTFLLKATPEGEFVWWSYVQRTSHHSGFADVIVSDRHERIYLSACNVGTRDYNTTHYDVVSIPSVGFASGGVYLLELSLTGELLNSYAGSSAYGAMLEGRHDPVPSYSYRDTYVVPQLHLNADSTIYMVGEVKEHSGIAFDIGSVESESQILGYMLKINPLSEDPGWKQIGTNISKARYGSSRMSSTVDSEGNLYIANYGRDMSFDGDTFDIIGSLVIKYDSDFNLLWKKRFENITISDIYFHTNGNLFFNGTVQNYGAVFTDIEPELYIEVEDWYDMMLGAMTQYGEIISLETIGDGNIERGQKITGNDCGELYFSGVSGNRDHFYAYDNTNMLVQLNDYTAPDSINGSFVLKIADSCLVGGCAIFCEDPLLLPNPSIFIYASRLKTDEYATYQWYNDGVLIPGEESQTYRFLELGEYNVVVTDLNGCSGESESYMITCDDGNLKPNPRINITGFLLTTGEYLTYQWYKSGILIPGAESESYEFSELGEYTVVVTESNGCIGESEVFILTCEIAALRPDPIINITGSLLSTAEYASYQWYLDDVEIPGATEQTYMFTEEGFYKVEVSSEYDCVGISESFEVRGLGISNLDITSLVIHPNPSNGEFTLSYDLRANADVNIEIKDITGKIIYSENNLNTSIGHHQKAIDLSRYAKGIYIATIKVGADKYTRKLILE